MKQAIILLVFIFIFQPCYSQRKKVGLVLGGGGAKGAAHIGVLKVLEEAEIPIDYISGTSIGAIIGGMYSIGYSAAQLDSLFRNQDWIYLFTDEVERTYKLYSAKEMNDKYVLNLSYDTRLKRNNPAGLISGQNIHNLFSSMTIGYHNVDSFDNLPIPFACVAVDLVSGEEVVLNKGSLPTSMRASMAIPGVFEPVPLGDMLLVDGGLINSVPANVVLDMGAEIIIAVDLNTGIKDYQEVKSIFGMIDQMTRIMQKCYYPVQKDEYDLYLNPNLKGYSAASFSNRDVDTIIQKGEDIAREHWDDLMKLKEEIYGDDCYDEKFERIKYERKDSILIGDISFSGITDDSEQWIMKRIKILENSKIRLDEIDNAISILYGMGFFSQVECVISDDTPHDIKFILKNKPQGDLNIGIRFDTDELASILLNTTIKHEFLRGGIFSATTRLGQNFYLSLSEQFGNNLTRNTSVSYLLKYNNFSVYEGKKKFDSFSFLSHSADIFFSGYSRKIKYMFGLHYDYFHYREEKYDSFFNNLALSPEGFFNYFASFSFDCRNQSYYPTKGLYTSLKLQLFSDNLITYNNGLPFSVINFDLSGTIKLSNRFCFLYAAHNRILFGEDIPLIYRNYMGGEIPRKYLPQQFSFSGVRNIQMFDNNIIIAKVALRGRILDNHYITMSLEYANSNEDFDFLNSRNIWGTSLKYSYNSMLGPLEFQVNYSNNDKRFGVFIGAGYIF